MTETTAQQYLVKRVDIRSGRVTYLQAAEDGFNSTIDRFVSATRFDHLKAAAALEVWRYGDAWGEFTVEQPPKQSTYTFRARTKSQEECDRCHRCNRELADIEMMGYTVRWCEPCTRAAEVAGEIGGS